MRLKFDQYVIDVARRELFRGTERVEIEPQVFDVLLYLARNPDRVIDREELLGAIWSGRIVSDSAITNRITAARRAIGDSGAAQRLIRTVPRKGVCFIGEVRDAGDEAPPAKAGNASLVRRRGALVAGGGVLLLCTVGFVTLSWIRPDVSPHEAPSALVVPRLPIALRPFDDLGSESRQSPLAAGITENLAVDLSRNQSVTTRFWTGQFGNGNGHAVRA
jgi:DNA-binding winged helix-turn-helix (wHTH) protein